MSLSYLSVCSGIEAATVAWHPLGWTPLAFSEFDKFPSAVLAHHYPDVPNHGDLNGFRTWPDYAPDILVGGTPCQSFSVAGLRQGLADPRGNLALVYLAAVERYRPRWVVWENVPGVLSSNKGRDFGAFLGALAELGYGFAYRILDAQYFGVPQRRRRVFVVGYLGDWRRAGAVLFEPESLRGHPPPSRETGQVAPTTPARRTGGGGLGTDFDLDGGLIPSTGDVAHCLNAGGMGRIDYETETMIAFSSKDYGADASAEVSPTLRAMGHNESHANGGGQMAVAYTLEARSRVQAVAFAQNQRDEVRMMPYAGALAAEPGAKQQTYIAQAVAFQERGRTGGRSLEIGGDTAYALTSPAGGGRAQERNILTPAMQVRRLTPTECERLQGFPDGYTQVPYHNKPAADGPRYKALGNSMAVPVMRWIGERIAAVEKHDG